MQISTLTPEPQPNLKLDGTKTTIAMTVNETKYFPKRDDQDEDNEDVPLLTSLSTNTKPGRTIERSNTRTRKYVHPQYAKKLKNERMTRGAPLSHEQIDCTKKAPFASSSSLLPYRGCCCIQCVGTKEVGIIECFGEVRQYY